MTDNTDKLMAEALFAQRYCDDIWTDENIISVGWYRTGDSIPYAWIEKEPVDPFYSGDDLERECRARRKADALEDYFEQRPDLWDLWNSYSRPYVYDVGESMREWRLDRIKWCFEQLAEKSHD